MNIATKIRPLHYQSSYVYVFIPTIHAVAISKLHQANQFTFVSWPQKTFSKSSSLFASLSPSLQIDSKVG